MKRVMVSGASGIVGYGILRSLRASGMELFLLGTSIHQDSVAPAFCDQFELAPRTDSPAYLAWLVQILRHYQIDMLIPGIEADLYCWNNYRSEIIETGALPLLNTAELVALCQDKWLFYQYLLEHQQDCRIPSSLSRDFDKLSAEFGLPFLLKPRRGFGSKGIVRISEQAQFEQIKAQWGDDILAQPIVGSDEEEYTVAGFGDGLGQLQACIAMRRVLSKDGFTDKAEVVSHQPFSTILSSLSQLFKPLGPTNFQFRKTTEGFCLLEINPRISSSTSIRTAFGYNESAMAVRFFLQQLPINQPELSGGCAVRYITEHIFYDHSLHL